MTYNEKKKKKISTIFKNISFFSELNNFSRKQPLFFSKKLEQKFFLEPKYLENRNIVFILCRIELVFTVSRLRTFVLYCGNTAIMIAVFPL